MGLVPGVFIPVEGGVCYSVRGCISLNAASSIHKGALSLRRSIQRQDIVAVCDLLLQVHHFGGIVELARAEKDDPTGRALELYRAANGSGGSHPVAGCSRY